MDLGGPKRFNQKKLKKIHNFIAFNRESLKSPKRELKKRAKESLKENLKRA